jgi:hypothetical protein
VAIEVEDYRTPTLPTAALAIITKPTEDRLDTLTRTIRQAHAECSQAMRTTLEAARRAGDALIEARKDIGHGGWLKYVEQTCGLNRRTANRYMTIAEHWDQIGHVSNLSEALGALNRVSTIPPSLEDCATMVTPTAKHVDITDAHRLGDEFLASLGEAPQPQPRPSSERSKHRRYARATIKHGANMMHPTNVDETDGMDRVLKAMDSLLEAFEGDLFRLNPTRIEMLSNIWDRIGALLERWSHDGDRPKMREVEEVES